MRQRSILHGDQKNSLQDATIAGFATDQGISIIGQALCKVDPEVGVFDIAIHSLPSPCYHRGELSSVRVAVKKVHYPADKNLTMEVVEFAALRYLY